MVEGTGGIDFILPIILAVVMANWVSHHLHPSGAYESDIEKLSKGSKPAPRESVVCAGATQLDLISLEQLRFEDSEKSFG